MKTKALISFAVTAKLICVFVFAYAKSRFSHDEAPIVTANIKRKDHSSFGLIMIGINPKMLFCKSCRAFIALLSCGYTDVSA